MFAQEQIVTFIYLQVEKFLPKTLTVQYQNKESGKNCEQYKL